MAIAPLGGIAAIRRPPTELELMEWARKAWAHFRPDEPEPERVEVLTRKTKSAVCRLIGAEAAGLPVIAKRARCATAEVEATIHANILPRFSISALAWRGMLRPEAHEDFCWLFMGDAGDTCVDLGSRRHRVLAAHWLADLHARSEGIEPHVTLPDRGPRDALARLREARATIRRGLENSVPPPPESLAGIDAILAQLDRVELHWSDVEARCEAFPRTLVHGDFVKKNMRLRDRGGSTELFVFDWEHAGFGFPGQDLAAVDPECYGAALREHWRGIDASQLRCLFDTGRLFRMVARTRWIAGSLGKPGCDWVASTLASHARQFDRMAHDAGWCRGAS